MSRVNVQRLQDQVIVIVGGTSGLGLSASRACLLNGAQVVVVGRDATKAATLIDEFGDRATVEAGDATDSTTSMRAVATAVAQFGRLTGLYHVAGGSGRKHGDGPLHALSDDGWDYTLRLNLDSLFYSNRAAIRQFLAQGQGGAILNMTSVLAYSPSPRFFATHAYAAAKSAVIGLTKAAASYYAAQNIRVNAVAPALMETPMADRAVRDPSIMQFVQTKQPLDGGRIGQPSDVDEAVVYLLSDASRFVTGQIVAIDGGWSVSEGQAIPCEEQPERFSAGLDTLKQVHSP